MPESLKVYSGERVDLTDYVHGANDYTKAVDKFGFERTWLDRRSRVLDGFRIRIEDQSISPGMVTVFNGNALNRDGQIINNEQAPEDSRSITLLGASQTFYVEIEFVENPSNVDARFFWDPTVANTPPALDGSEFSLNVATRLTPDWRIVTPVSTTGFAQTSNPNSIRVPVGIFSTDGANVISTGPSNPGLSLVRAASVVENDVALGATTLRLVDCRIFPSTPVSVVVDFGDPSAETRTITGIDRVNGIVTLNAALASAHSAGAIIRVTSGNADLMQENVDPSDTSPNPDPAQRLWQANELRGTAITASKQVYSGRDDLNIRSLKDYVDFLSAQLRELKFGNTRPGSINTAPPSSFATRPRYFDRAGSVLGARSNSVSIGNGTTSFGDFNSTDGAAALTDAIAALPASGGTIFVKAGTYTFASSVSVSKPIRVIGEGINSVIFDITAAAAVGLVISAATSLENITVQKTAGLITTVDLTAAVDLDFHSCSFVGQIRANGVAASVRAYNTLFTAYLTGAIFTETGGGSLQNCEFLACDFVAPAATAVFLNASLSQVVVDGCTVNAVAFMLSTAAVTDLVITNSQANVAVFLVLASAALSGITLSNNYIVSSNLTAGNPVIGLVGTTVDRVTVTNTYFSVTNGTSSALSPSYLIYVGGTVSNGTIHVDKVTCNLYAGSFIHGIAVADSPVASVTVTSCTLPGTRRFFEFGVTGASVSGGSVVLRDCVHDNEDRHADVYGFFLNSSSRPDAVSIESCTFKNYQYNLGAGSVRAGVELSSSALAGGTPRVLINGCQFDQIGISSTPVSSAVRLSAAAGLTAPGSVSVTNSQITSIFGAVASGIYLTTPGFGNGLITEIVNNNIDIVSSPVTAAYGIYVENASDTVASTYIAGNAVRNVLNTSAGAPATGIYMQDVNRSVITGNKISQCESNGVVDATTGACIRLVAATNNCEVLDNVIDQSVGTTDAKHNILMLSTGTNITISRNTVRTSASSDSGIKIVRPALGSAVTNLSVDNNRIYYNSTAVAIGAGINATLGSTSFNVSIAGNTIIEATAGAHNASHSGISVVGYWLPSPTSSVICSNNTLIGPKTGVLASYATRHGILIVSCQQTNISGNIVNWNEFGVLEGHGITITDGGGGANILDHAISSNFIRSLNAVGIYEINLVGNVLDGLIMSNILGDSIAAAQVNPAIQPATWVYGVLGVLGDGNKVN